MDAAGYERLIYDTSRDCGLSDNQAKIIIAQARFESGNFKSNVFKKDNNFFGMKMPSQRDKRFIERPSTIIMTAEGLTPYAHYKNPENSIKDLLLSWHVYNKTDWRKILTPLQYGTYLKSKGYYGASAELYINGISKIYAQLGQFSTGSGNDTAKLIVPLICGAIFFYLVTK